MTTLLAYPNVSEGRDGEMIGQIARAFGPGLLDVHSDGDHDRTAYTLAGEPGELADVVIGGAARAVAIVDLAGRDGVHPRVGALDVAPIVYLTEAERGAACAEALVLANRLGSELDVPVFLYGALAGGRTRAQLRRGGPDELARRVAAGELTPDFGPSAIDPPLGATLVAARPPLVAFNVMLAPEVTLDAARGVAAAIREGGPAGLPGVRAIGVWLRAAGRAQVSCNVEDPAATSPARVLREVAGRVAVTGAELVGLAPEAALADFPDDVALANRATIEDRLAERGRSD